jgi:hypothetical protein
MKITKILVALLFSLSVSTAYAGELTVTGSMEATYQSETTGETGNPLGMDRELKFAGSTELDNGITVSVFQDTGDSLTYGNSQIAFGNVAGFATIYVGSDSDPVDAVDDITPSAYEEANGSGSGSYNDVGGQAGQMGIGAKFDLPILGAVNYKYYPKIDSQKNADNVASGQTSGGEGVGSASSISIKTNMADLPFVGGFLDGATLTTAYGESDHSTVANLDDAFDLVAAINYVNGPISLGIQKKYHNEGMAATPGESAGYKDTVIGIAYAVSDDFSVSYNRYTSYPQTRVGAPEQETDAINIGYTMGGMTIGFQDASTDNSGYATGDNDTRTLGVSVAF